MSKFISLKNIPIDQIDPDPKQPRKVFNEDGIKELGHNMLKKGQTTPICVTPRDSRYKLVYGERRTRGAKVVGMKTLRAEVWELTDIEVGLRQARELLHTELVEHREGSPAEDDFFINLFYRIVEERISCSKIEHDEYCPRCYQCPYNLKGHKCRSALTLKEYAKMIGEDKEVKGKGKTSISYIFSRCGLREEVPEVRELETEEDSNLKPSCVNTLASLHKSVDLMKEKEPVIALATKATNKRLGSPSPSKKSGETKRGSVHALEQISSKLRNEDVPIEIKKKLIYEDEYGPLKADEEMRQSKEEKTVVELSNKEKIELLLGEWERIWKNTKSFNLKPLSGVERYQLVEGLAPYPERINKYIKEDLCQGKDISELYEAIKNRFAATTATKTKQLKEGGNA